MTDTMMRLKHGDAHNDETQTRGRFVTQLQKTSTEHPKEIGSGLVNLYVSCSRV